jgi:O-antigen/teichoic acid export membrane protein
MNFRAIRKVLRTGALVFGLSGVFLLISPGTFLGLLQLEKSNALIWSMRMIGITVFALAGNMWNNAGQSDDRRVGNVAKIMCVSAAALGVVTLMIPAHMGWFTYLYSAIGLGFSIAYLVAIFQHNPRP